MGGHLGGLGTFSGVLQNFFWPLAASNKYIWNPQLKLS
jgi:hypothetical protein